MSVIVTPQQIYNEFSSGMQDVSAIRDFVKYQYDKEHSDLKYLLLFGDIAAFLLVLIVNYLFKVKF